jgi:predicted SAM-dependent methyltransferase
MISMLKNIINFKTINNIKKENNKIKIHIGCGEINMPGWINIDAREFPHVHVVNEELDLKEFVDNSINEIYLCHVLEHFDFKESEEKLKLFYKKLKPGGKLIISVPDFNLIIKGYIDSGKNLNSFRMALMGGQDYKYNYHKSIYDEKLLTNIFKKVGFTKVEEWNPSKEFKNQNNDWSSRKLRVGFQFYQISLNLCAIKKN